MLDDERTPGNPPLDRRSVFLSLLAVAIAIAAALAARVLLALIALITNVAFFHRVSTGEASPREHALGWLVVFVPAIGGLVVGLMARFGSAAIRGHGIPEAMEQVLVNDSRIPARMTILKPVSAAISIGTGGPFGAEGPIIATGSALGSLLGQMVSVTADERKTLLAAGAAAGMSAVFGTPVAAVLLAIELLLFEFRARSIIPVALAAATATAVRIGFVGDLPVFPLPVVDVPNAVSMVVYVAVGALLGFCAVAVTKLVYAIEDAFEKLPLHWMYWPILGGLVVGLVGYVEPRTLGVGYENIEAAIVGSMTGKALLVLATWKLVSWSVSLGSGTSGGTLAPLLTIGAALGGVATSVVATVLPGYGVDPRIGALVGMAAMFAGASRALLASVVFAFEATRQPIGLLPLLGGCAASYLVSCLAMVNSIMTEKIARRGVRIPSDYQADVLDRLAVERFATAKVRTLAANETVGTVRAAILARTDASLDHTGFPVTSGDALVGVVTRRDLFESTHEDDVRIDALIRRHPLVVHPDTSLRVAADLMVVHEVGRVVVVRRSAPTEVVGILTRSDLLKAHRGRIGAETERHRLREAVRPWRKLPA